MREREIHLVVQVKVPLGMSRRYHSVEKNKKKIPRWQHRTENRVTPNSQAIGLRVLRCDAVRACVIIKESKLVVFRSGYHSPLPLFQNPSPLKKINECPKPPLVMPPPFLISM